MNKKVSYSDFISTYHVSCIHCEIGAIIQRGAIEHEQIIYISSNCCMKQLMDWLRSELLETALYWAGVVSVRLGAIAERKVSQHSGGWGSV